MNKFLTLFFAGCVSGCTAFGAELSRAYPTGSTFEGVRLLGVVAIPTYNGLSGLAWDEDENLLYAVSDFGRVYHIKIEFTGDELSSATVMLRHFLKDRSGSRFFPPYGDAEGLDVLDANNNRSGDSRLVVSFEVKPRISEFDNTGRWLKDRQTPQPFQQAGDYQDPNKGMESLVFTPNYGLVAALEKPFRSASRREVILASVDQYWRYPLSNHPGSAVVAMENLGERELLVMERAFVSPILPLTIKLSRVSLDRGALLKPKSVATFSSSKGWSLDNFEALARHKGQRYFTVSDNNNSSLQRTLLFYFEVL